MPKATSDKFSRAHIPSAKNAAKAESSSSGGGGGARNPIFKTERFGQHILNNPLVAQGIVDKANLKPTDNVLEVGPGTGNLTVRILDKAKHVTAVEMDPRMAAELTKRVQGKPEQRKLDIIIGDFVKAELPYFDVCISNTPYQISSPLVFRLLSHRPLPRVCILMFQREFALRLVARPGTEFWSRLSANVQLYAKVDHVMKVAKSCFRPPPMVESSVVRIVPLDPPPPVRFEEFDGLTRIIFGRPNKVLHANFQARGVLEMLEANWKTWCSQNDKIIEDGVSFKAKVDQILRDTGMFDSRAAKMDKDDILKLLAAFHDEGIHFA
ncbi:S-adenosyl-L-methionine-dependent methyltransferase [Schizophyllum amplum]|uniref:rRNA adenine N(6)-methyltransferase n=1 Tax=Schizophyllum amplum TaxID=97359 RepID=A0A550CPL6_9AGAR|nr:S-adenosyl-L-methionine-dependent methyltransferase [Auriculariopsis ampla]